MANTIYKLTHENILDNTVLEQLIYPNLELNYYYNEDFDEEFYIDLALKGFISIWYEERGREYLLPEMQFQYAVLDFKDLHISKKVQKLLKKEDQYEFFYESYFDEVIEILQKFHTNSWIQGKYIELLKKLQKSDYKKEQFHLNIFGLKDRKDDTIVAAEIGYGTYKNKVYTSLSGFSSRDRRYNNYGNLQLVLTAQYLQNNGYEFWNLGHPFMEYKQKLGAAIIEREEFLERIKKFW